MCHKVGAFSNERVACQGIINGQTSCGFSAFLPHNQHFLQCFSKEAMSLAHFSLVLSEKIHQDLIVYNQKECFTIACHMQSTSGFFVAVYFPFPMCSC